MSNVLIIYALFEARRGYVLHWSVLPLTNLKWAYVHLKIWHHAPIFGSAQYCHLSEHTHTLLWIRVYPSACCCQCAFRKCFSVRRSASFAPRHRRVTSKRTAILARLCRNIVAAWTALSVVTREICGFPSYSFFLLNGRQATFLQFRLYGNEPIWFLSEYVGCYIVYATVHRLQVHTLGRGINF